MDIHKKKVQQKAQEENQNEEVTREQVEMEEMEEVDEKQQVKEGVYGVEEVVGGVCHDVQYSQYLCDELS